MLSDWAVRILIVFGIAYVLGHSAITLRWRTFVAKFWAFPVELIECPACIGWHTGWILTVFGYSLFPFSWSGALSAAFFYAATNFILGRATGLMKLD